MIQDTTPTYRYLSGDNGCRYLSGIGISAVTTAAVRRYLSGIGIGIGISAVTTAAVRGCALNLNALYASTCVRVRLW